MQQTMHLRLKDMRKELIIIRLFDLLIRLTKIIVYFIPAVLKVGLSAQDTAKPMQNVLELLQTTLSTGPSKAELIQTVKILTVILFVELIMLNTGLKIDLRNGLLSPQTQVILLIQIVLNITLDKLHLLLLLRLSGLQAVQVERQVEQTTQRAILSKRLIAL